MTLQQVARCPIERREVPTEFPRNSRDGGESAQSLFEAGCLRLGAEIHEQTVRGFDELRFDVSATRSVIGP